MSKLLVIRLGALGDLLHVSPSLAQIQAKRPDLAIHVVTTPAYRPLVEQFSGVKQVWTLDKTAGWRGLWQLAQALRGEAFDSAVNLHPSFKTALLLWLAQPGRTVTYRKQKMTRRGQAQRTRARRHAVADFWQPFSRLTGDNPTSDDPDATVWAPQLHLGENSADSGTMIGIVPGVGAKRANRAWPPGHYQALIGQLLEAYPDMTLRLIGGADETPLANELAANHPRVENCCGRLSLLESAVALSQCRVVIGGDTGPLHLAAAVGVPVIGIYGPTAVARTGPRGLGRIQTLTPDTALACWPCELAQCPLTGDDHLACLVQIRPQTVLDAVHRFLKGD